jgi:hypothetical protein
LPLKQKFTIEKKYWKRKSYEWIKLKISFEKLEK